MRVMVSPLLERIRRREAKVGVVGLGYVGLPLGMAFAEAGFRASAFTPSYGLAEATLAVTVMPPGEGIRVELVEEERLSGAERDLSRPARYRAIVNCGKPLNIDLPRNDAEMPSGVRSSSSTIVTDEPSLANAVPSSRPM